MGFSGFIEVVGLSLWGYELFANMRAGKKLEKEKTGWAGKIPGRFEITPQTKVADVLSRYPESLEIFLRLWFRAAEQSGVTPDYGARGHD